MGPSAQEVFKYVTEEVGTTAAQALEIYGLKEDPKQIETVKSMSRLFDSLKSEHEDAVSEEFGRFEYFVNTSTKNRGCPCFKPPQNDSRGGKGVWTCTAKPDVFSTRVPLVLELKNRNGLGGSKLIEALKQAFERIRCLSQVNDFLRCIPVVVGTGETYVALVFEQTSKQKVPKYENQYGAIRIRVIAMKDSQEASKLLCGFQYVPEDKISEMYYTKDAPMLLGAMRTLGLPVGYCWVRNFERSMNNVYEVCHRQV